MRIVSLLPSATEIVCALGYESALVGRSHECDYPSAVRHLPVCTASKIAGALTSEEIHTAVGSVLQHDGSMYSVDAALLRALEPTHIVTQIQCEVCAVSLRDVEAAIADWSGLTPPKIVPLNPQSLDDVLTDITRTAIALNDQSSGVRLIERMRNAVDEVAGRSRLAADKPRVATIEWMSPLMAAGNWAPELVELAGGINVFGASGQHSPWLEWEAFAAADPDLIVVFPCGFAIEDIERDLHLLTGRAEWPKFRAVRNGDVFLVDGNQYCNRPGPRLVDSLRIFAEIFHPDRFAFGFEGKAWKQWRA